jgi:cyclopropane-fatty-acyl-phospholipid synthase
LAALLVVSAPIGQGLNIVAWCLAGLAGWTLIEYFLHRVLLHGVQPFSGWHAAHHQRPMALIGTPTVLSAALVVVLVFLPVMWLSGVWHACASTAGVLVGYLGYSLMHHAMHHWRTDIAWLRRRKRWHASHHHDATPGCFGVTSGFWDHVFRSQRRARPMRRTARQAEPSDVLVDVSREVAHAPSRS